MKYKYILFDLDGTITESGPGIMNSVEYALNKMNREVGERDTLKKFIGPPLNQWRNIMGCLRKRHCLE